ncbi:pyridoxine/pyridoxamine 5'-phosphate oxidase [Streptomyces sp. NPDC055632]
MSGSPAPNVREWLRELEVFAGPLPSFDPAGAPEEPEEPFLVWLGEAVAAGLPDPHAMTLSTVDEHGDPWARVLILKNVDEHGWQFAAHADSPKGRHLSARPTAALAFYWPALGRQARLRGPVGAESPEGAAADFLARSATARAEALPGRQSRRLDSPAQRDAAIEASLGLVEQNPSLVEAGRAAAPHRADRLTDAPFRPALPVVVHVFRWLTRSGRGSSRYSRI